MNTTATAGHLATIRELWPDLLDAKTAQQPTTWPPTMGISHYLRGLEDEARAEAAAERAERHGDAPGERPVPLRLAVLDTIHVVETAMLAVADQVALLQPADLPAAERWRYNASWPHGVPWACIWLTGALDWLPAMQADRVAGVAREAVARIERVLGTARQTSNLPEPCPHCRGLLQLHGGDGRTPAVACRDCGRTWTDQHATAA